MKSIQLSFIYKLQSQILAFVKYGKQTSDFEHQNQTADWTKVAPSKTSGSSCTIVFGIICFSAQLSKKVVIVILTMSNCR